ncbi:glycosyltransferase [Alginatibacterium sediminis]|uniref:Glycosyltransferase n=1 Tax=Alginatibacterium sediminis TaxID=2164068 RepID=A0A420EAX0_9ALTE|nr:glycosyltransferase [Alginatibacterium sediminis]RKF17803.1 glycosyltransferase [Alginatibacterium sediminis]
MILYEIAIPVLNEEATLEQQINTVMCRIKSLESKGRSISVVIADNGSVDRTRAIAESLVAQNPKLLRFVSVGRRGVGLALKQAWRTSAASVVGYMDLDLATDLKHLDEVINLFESSTANFVYGTRLHPESVVIGRTLKREFSSRVFNLILKTYIGSRFSDGMCGFKFLHKSYVDDIIRNGASSDGWFFCTELLVVAERLNLNVAELPVAWTDDSESKVKIVPLAIEYLKAMRVLKRNA